MLLERGIYEGKFFHDWMADLLQAKGVTKFGHLVDEESSKHRHRLQVIASDVTHRRMLVLPGVPSTWGSSPTSSRSPTRFA